MSDYNSKVHFVQGGDKLVAESGGTVEIQPGGTLKMNGAALNMKSGEVTLGGTNPTSVATGLTTITGAVAVIKTATAPGDDPVTVTVDYGGSVAAGQLDIYAWKNTGGTDPTLVASTNSSAVISWIAFGT